MRSSSLCLRPRISSSPSLSRFRTPYDRLLRRLHVSKFAIKTHNRRLRIQANADSNNLVIQDITSEKKKESSNLQTIFNRFWNVALPYWTSEDKVQARLRLAGVFALTLATTGVSVGFNFLGRDFYNALASKDQELFTKQLLYYLGAFAGGIPIFVLRDFGKETLALRWRAWMTKNFLDRYFDNRTFYMIQSQSLIDNPDQRIVDDVSSFTGTALSFGLTFFTAAVDLVSFSNILFGIYPPLFAVLIAYSLGGTALSVLIGKGLVSLNFMQEKKEADFRYGLVRIRENAESIAFYGGEKNEMELLLQRFKEAFENLTQLLIASRNLDFFTSGYRYLIQILPAAVVAPMYFSGKIEFGVINQSYSAFNHVLGDFSLIVYQFQAISSFSAVIDRLGEFNDILERSESQLAGELKPKISLMMSSQTRMSLQDSQGATDLTNRRLLEISHLTLKTPQYTMTLINDLTLVVNKGEHLLIMGPSGSGKTSLLRAIAGLWSSGEGTIIFCLNNSDQSSQKPAQAVETKTNGSPRTGNYATEKSANEQVENNVQCAESMFFLPQRPYMVLGTLRQQLLYPKWFGKKDPKSLSDDALPFSLQNQDSTNKFCDLDTVPSKEEITRVLQKVHLDHILTRYEGLDSNVDWPSVLSLGEQQRLAFARLLLARPKLALLDESTSALDEINEARLYEEVAAAGITYISVGHRTTLRKYHSKLLCLTDSAPDMHGQNWITEDIEQEKADLLESIA